MQLKKSSLLTIAIVSGILAGCGKVGDAPKTAESTAQMQPAPQPSPNDKNSQMIEKGKKMLLDRMKDPDSTQWRKIHVNKFVDETLVCGEFNSKNAMGGYVGYKKFYVTLDSDTPGNIGIIAVENMLRHNPNGTQVMMTKESIEGYCKFEDS